MMFHRNDGKLYGVLNDFDLAVRLNESPRSTSKQRTGTKPYMAIDLLVAEPPVHLPRHDLESFLYVLVCLTCQIEGSPLAEWKYLRMDDLYDKKNTVLTNKPFPPIKDEFENFQFARWVTAIRFLFNDGFFKRSSNETSASLAKMSGGSPPPPFNHATLGDAVTFAKFAAILQAPTMIPS
jgi:hypothetical protein